VTGEGFDALHPAVQYHVVNSLGWAALRPLQEQAVRPALRGDDALLIAPTAGGKTEAAMARPQRAVRVPAQGVAEQP